MNKPIMSPFKFSLFFISFFLFKQDPVCAQGNEYDNAIAQFVGDKKWDIEKPGALEGIAAPNFEGVTLDGKAVSLEKLKGQVVVLNFWFIACAPCRLEVNPLNEVVKQFEGKDVVFLSVAREKEADLKAHLQKTRFLFQTMADPALTIVNKTYHLFGYPTTIVIDKAGKIKYYTLGGKINEDAVRKELQAKLVPVITTCLSKP